MPTDPICKTRSYPAIVALSLLISSSLLLLEGGRKPLAAENAANVIEIACISLTHHAGHNDGEALYQAIISKEEIISSYLLDFGRNVGHTPACLYQKREEDAALFGKMPLPVDLKDECVQNLQAYGLKGEELESLGPQLRVYSVRQEGRIAYLVDRSRIPNWHHSFNPEGLFDKLRANVSPQSRLYSWLPVIETVNIYESHAFDTVADRYFEETRKENALWETSEEQRVVRKRMFGNGIMGVSVEEIRAMLQQRKGLISEVSKSLTREEKRLLKKSYKEMESFFRKERRR